MSRKRRQITIAQQGAWIFNRMADVYDARPAYPGALLTALCERAGTRQRVLDVGAGIGHLALPLAERGLKVTALEPAGAMLARLRTAAAQRCAELELVQGAAEALPFAPGAFDLVVLADALHFVDASLAAREVQRVLAADGVLAVVSCEFAETPFMSALARVLEQTTTRRPRASEQALRHLAALSQVRLEPAQRFDDETALDQATLERLLRSISFVGPAMIAERFADLRERLRELPGPRVWARRITLHAGRKRRRAIVAVPRPNTRVT